MPALLNFRWESFARSRAGGMSNADSYRGAGYKCESDVQARQRGDKLGRKDVMKARVMEIRDALATNSLEAVGMNREWVLRELKENYGKAAAATEVTDRQGNKTGEFTFQGSVANRSLELMGKELGMFVDRFVVGDMDSELEGMKPEELRSFVKATAMSVGLRCVEMNDDELRTFILRNAGRVGLRVVEEGGEDSGGAPSSEDGGVSTVSEAGAVSPPRTH